MGKEETVSTLLKEYELTRSQEILDKIVQRYHEYKAEEHIEWMEELIDSSHLSDEIYDGINQTIHPQ